MTSGLFVRWLCERARDCPELLDVVGRVAPASETFDFGSAEVFESKAKEVALGWLQILNGRSFLVRIHRRGFGRIFSSHEEEQRISGALLEALSQIGASGRTDFEDPDAIIDIETVEHRAGMAIWTREQLRDCPFLRLK